MYKLEHFANANAATDAGGSAIALPVPSYRRAKNANEKANSIGTDQTAPKLAVCSRSALFAQTYLSENLGSLHTFSH